MSERVFLKYNPDCIWFNNYFNKNIIYVYRRSSWNGQKARNHSPSERGSVTSAPSPEVSTPGGGQPGG